MSTLAPAPGKYLSAGVWLAQILVSLVFIASGLTKLLTPMPELAAMMRWPGEYPEPFVRFLALVDLAGGLGILLPSLIPFRPRLTVLASLCCIVLQILAIGFHASRGEFAVLPLNLVLLPLCVFVLWGRGRRVPIA
jgi:uncharacterized membrane protein YphA (DoxX/SURF4 family)